MTDSEFNIWPAVLMGETADIYFSRAAIVLRNEAINPLVVMEFFPERAGVLCGVNEAFNFLGKLLPKNLSEVWGLEDGAEVLQDEVSLRIQAPYSTFALYQTAICGMLSQSTAWATAARECVEAAKGVPVISFGAQHVHPNVAHIMDYAAIVGGCTACSTPLGAKLAGVTPVGSMSHAYIICVGDLVKAAHLFDKHIPPEVPRMALVGTFKDEVEESLRVAAALRDKLQTVQLNTPAGRGQVTPTLVNEVRAHLDLHGFKKVGIFVSGGLTSERINKIVGASAAVIGFGVGSAITSAPPNNFSADICEVEGHTVAMRGRIPGITINPRLKQLM